MSSQDKGESSGPEAVDFALKSFNRVIGVKLR